MMDICYECGIPYRVGSFKTCAVTLQYNTEFWNFICEDCVKGRERDKWPLHKGRISPNYISNLRGLLKQTTDAKDIEIIRRYIAMNCNLLLKTGGATGTDSIFELVCFEHHIDYHVISFKGHKTQAHKEHIVELDQHHLEVADKMALNVAKYIGRQFATCDAYTKNLLRRDYHIIYGTQCVIGFGYMDLQFNISGGTAWGICYASLMMKPIFFYDLTRKQWLMRTYTKTHHNSCKCNWITTNIVDISIYDKIAGIGTRDIGTNYKLIYDIITTLLTIGVVKIE